MPIIVHTWLPALLHSLSPFSCSKDTSEAYKTNQALHFDSHISKTSKISSHFSSKHLNNTSHFHIQVCYSNVIVLSHVSLICVNILMAKNMVSFDRANGLCVISQIRYYLRPNRFSVHKKNQFKPYEMKITAHVLTCYLSHDFL